MEPVGGHSEAPGIGPPDFKRLFTTELAKPKDEAQRAERGSRRNSQDGQDVEWGREPTVNHRLAKRSG